MGLKPDFTTVGMPSVRSLAGSIRIQHKTRKETEIPTRSFRPTRSIGAEPSEGPLWRYLGPCF